jgi:hypothetical protein
LAYLGILGSSVADFPEPDGPISYIFAFVCKSIPFKTFIISVPQYEISFDVGNIDE